MSVDPHILEALDACRPDSDDLRQPELAAAAEAIGADPRLAHVFSAMQQADRQFAAAIRKVVVPEGLADRIMAKIDAATTSVGVEQPAPVANRRSSRRGWLGAIAAVAAGLVMTVVGLRWLSPSPQPMSVSSLVADAGDWYRQLEGAADWRSLPAAGAVKGFPQSSAVRGVPRGWADATSLVGESAVAYNLSDRAGRAAMLFVIPHAPAIAGSRPPLTPGSSTGGLMIGCWQSQGMVYVLVVQGDLRSYRSLIDASEAPLAISRPRLPGGGLG